MKAFNPDAECPWHGTGAPLTRWFATFEQFRANRTCRIGDAGVKEYAGSFERNKFVVEKTLSGVFNPVGPFTEITGARPLAVILART